MIMNESTQDKISMIRFADNIAILQEHSNNLHDNIESYEKRDIGVQNENK